MKNINSTIIETGSAGVGFVLAQYADNKFGDKLAGFGGTAIAGGLGAALIYGASYVKPATAAIEAAGMSMLAYSVLSGIKKVAMKSSTRRTGILLDIEQALPGKLLAPTAPAMAPSTSRLSQSSTAAPSSTARKINGYDDDAQKLLAGLGNIDYNQLAGAAMADSLV